MSSSARLFVRKNPFKYFYFVRDSLFHRNRSSFNLTYQGGDELQIYSVIHSKIHEHNKYYTNAVIKERSAILKKWLKPILAELEGRTFCVHLGDYPGDVLIEGMPNLCYCKRHDDMRDLKLIPDAHYQLHLGYVQTRKYGRLYKINWDDKIPKAVFRGSCTGAKPLSVNMRARLCTLEHDLIDARISRVNNGWEREEIAHLLGNELSEYAMAHYKYQIDIDGNTNAWCALFWKLMSGSLTFKMNSEWAQWYYPRLASGVHYESFSEFDELVDKINYYFRHDQSARAMAINAQNFTKNFTVKDQLAFFIEQVIR